jgi:hypothetical protein
MKIMTMMMTQSGALQRGRLPMVKVTALSVIVPD